MFFSYTASVLLLSLAIFGGWCLCRDLWRWFLEPSLARLPDGTLLIFVKNQENGIEELMRCFLLDLNNSEAGYDAVVVDCGSTDLTPLILERLTADEPLVHFMVLRENFRPAGEMLPLCRGSIVHVLDMTGRLTGSEFLFAAASILRR